MAYGEGRPQFAMIYREETPDCQGGGVVGSLLEDDREIAAVTLSDDCIFKVDTFGITKIEAYREGQYCCVPWFAVWVDGKLRWRINGARVESVVYAQG